MRSASGPKRPDPRGQDPGPQDDARPAAFLAAVADLEAGRDQQLTARPELSFEDVPAPRTLAPFAAAIAATVRAGDTDVGWGKFVLLYDPDGQPGWAGPFRVIAYIRADLEPEIAADPLVGQVGWSWLTEALNAKAAGYENTSGTVTRVVTEGFGTKQGEPTATEFELRASWSPAPAGQPGLAGHVAAWCGVLCAASGMPELAEGVTALRPQGSRPR